MKSGSLVITYFATFSKHVAVSVVIVTRRSRFGEHIWHIVRGLVPLERRSTTITTIVRLIVTSDKTIENKNKNTLTNRVDFRRVICNIIRKLLSEGRPRSVYIDKIPIRKPSKSIRCTPATYEEIDTNNATTTIRGHPTQSSRYYTYSHITNVFVIANGFIGFICGWRALSANSVTIARISASVIRTTNITGFYFTVGRTTRTLKSTRSQVRK